MTDQTGRFNKVILKTECESMAAFEKDMQESMKEAQTQGSTSKHVDMCTQGKREIYRVW